MNILRTSIAALITLGLAGSANAALSTGDIAFVGFNADGNDDFAFIALVAIPQSEPIVFTDNEWTGSAFNTGEGGFTWTPPIGGIARGQVVFIDNCSGTPTPSVGTVGAGTMGFGNTNEALYAIQGSQASPTAFLSVVANDYPGSGALLSGTPFISGTNCVLFDSTVLQDFDVFMYNGTTNFATPALARAAINNPANWIAQDGSGDQDADSIAPDSPFSIASASWTLPVSMSGFSIE